MNSTDIARIAVVLAAVAAVPPVAAQNYDTRVFNISVAAEALEQRTPSFPSGLRNGQEGWVSVNYVIDAEGAARDPVVLDSVGGNGFEESARAAVLQWRFEPPGEELANNTSNIRFEIHDGRDKATPNFLRRYRSILQHLHYEETADARDSVESTLARGGWNLYESTMLWLMAGRVEGADGNSAGKLENYRRALGVSNRNSLDDEELRDLLARMFELEIELSQYAAARRTLDRLSLQPGAGAALAGLRGQVAELDRKLAGDEPLAARATVFDPSHSGDGQPIWSYTPARQSFSFAALDGNVERFEARCERNRLEGPVEAGKSWSLPGEAKNCRVIVFGDDGANFEFVEHVESEAPDGSADAAVAWNDVLD